MDATDFASSVMGLRLRITPLETDGSVTPSGHVLTTDGFMRATWSLEYTDGDEIEEKNAQGAVCVSWKGDDSLKRVNFSLALCSPDPESSAMLAGGDVLWDGSDIVGYKAPEIGSLSTQPVALEIWSYANVAGKPASGSAYWHWVFPYVKLRFNGDREYSNGALANEFSGQGLGNDAATLDGWTYGGLDRPFAYVRTNTLPSTGWTGTPLSP